MPGNPGRLEMSSAIIILVLCSIGNLGVAMPDIGCITTYAALEQPPFSVQSAIPLTWLEMQQLCWKERSGYGLLQQCTDFPADVLAMCPEGSLVPLNALFENGGFVWNIAAGFLRGLDYRYCRLKKEPDLSATGSYLTLRWPDQDIVIVNNDTKFTCGICSMADRTDAITKGVYPAHNNADYKYDIELVSYDWIDDMSQVGKDGALTTKLLADLAAAFNISVSSLHWHGAALNADEKAVVHVYYDRGDLDMDWLYYVHWSDPYLEHKTVDNFEMAMIKLNTECVDNRPKSHLGLQKKAMLTGYINVTLDVAAMRVTIRECYWDARPGVETAVWSDQSKWEMRWGPCQGRKTLSLDILQLKEPVLTLELRNFDLQIALTLVEPKRTDLLKYVHDFTLMSNLANLILMAHSNPSTTGTVFAVLASSLVQNLGIIYMMIPLEPGKTSFLTHTKMVNLLVVDQPEDNPVIGLVITLPDSNSDTEPSISQLNHTEMDAKLFGAHLVVTVSDSIAFSSSRLVIGTYAAHLEARLPAPQYVYDDSVDSWMAIVHVAFTRDGSGSLRDFVDIAFKPRFRRHTQRGKCAERLFAADEWIDNCRILKSMRDDLLVCRCGITFTEGNFTSGVYLIYGADASLSSYLKNNRNLIVVIVFVTVMSVLGLLSVIVTAISFPDWRKDQGHQIFLQMVLALTVNVILGFVNNFISIDTKTVECIAIGVLRHYSFLAMFFWMMILSGLQVKRLTTIAGAKTTTHLILKVSLIAWGLPLIPIVVMLAWDTGFYKSELSNRGYCYPEGVAFQATVQAPAAAILAANLVIFVIILNHIYGWVKCNKDIVVRKHTADDRAAQLRNFANSVFVFFLFGFTWLFHFLSEEGIINSEFLFEFMFLITASFHLFMLALFFIGLDNKTKTLWLRALCKGQPVKPKPSFIGSTRTGTRKAVRPAASVRPARPRPSQRIPPPAAADVNQ